VSRAVADALKDLQQRVDAALAEPEDEAARVPGEVPGEVLGRGPAELPGEGGAGPFADFAESAADLTARLMAAARHSGAAAALDEVERLRGAERPGRLRRALMEFLVHDPAAAGLRIPPLEERAPWKVRPSRRRREEPS
jgi:hypothetical protein